MASVGDWSDVFDFTITPAVSGEEGFQLAQQIMQD
jgi:hypothetical protein